MPPNGIDGSLDRGKLRKTSSGNEVTLSISCMLIRTERATVVRVPMLQCAKFIKSEERYKSSF